MNSLLAPSVFLALCLLMVMIFAFHRSAVAMVICGLIATTGGLSSVKMAGLPISWLWVLSPLWLSVIGYAIAVLFYAARWAWRYRGQ